MTDENLTPLSGREYKEVGLAVFETLSNYPEIPDTIHLDYQSLDALEHIGLMTVPGGKYLKMFVTGGFLAQLPFQIVYKTSPTANGQYLEAEKLMDDIAEYMEKQRPILSDGRYTEQIVFDSVTYRSKAEDDGSIVFVRQGTIIYEK